jgi:4-amino-4-deoxy-L-arabinose transferase-like glycosyltransferase
MKKNAIIDVFAPILFGIGYIIVNLLTLLSFPYTHSDEPWLAGLSKAYMDQQTIFTTEHFFDLFPRQPHGIKSLFHMIQSIFIKLFGFNISSVRLLSLLAALICLVLIYLIAKKHLKSSAFALLSTILLAMNIQFIYGAHFARQEILMFLTLILAYYLYSNTHFTKTKQIIIIASVIGLSIGFHPNAFIIALMFGCVLIYDLIAHKCLLKHILIYGTVLAGYALLYIGISLIGNSNFFIDYWTYGSTLSVNADHLSRFVNLNEFEISETNFDRITKNYKMNRFIYFRYNKYIFFKK